MINNKFIFLLSFVLSNAFFIFASSCSIISQYDIDLYVDDVLDGDTFISNGKKYRILGIDTPEVFDSLNNFNPTVGIQYFYGKLASNIAIKLLKNSWVSIENNNVDKYGRYIVKTTLYNGIDFSCYMVENGYAKVRYISSNKYSPFYYYDNNYIEKLFALENEAKLNKKGFWKESSDNIKKIFP